MKPTILASLVLVSALSACGSPGSDTVFTKDNPILSPPGEETTAALESAPEPPPPTLRTKRYTGFYRRVGEDSRFQPCGTKLPLVIFGPIEARVSLHERFRYSSVWQGQKFFGVFDGAIITDTVRATRADTGKKTVRTRFFITRVDSLRVWQSRDCGGMRVS